MKKAYLIQYNIADSEAFETRLKKIGPWVKYFSDNWIVESELNAEELYKKLYVGYEDKSILVIQIDSNNYYGRMNTKLWDYLKPRRKK
ncbi:hypothetical protein [Tenacibaculum soleae]|uniref:hypothetical protein n=1 Tax=Tenacibaculum soleae TaxID=447689 RepID=UPI0022FFD1F9|nr:hypothetical protein [Tenacibaculum soleae]